MKFNLIVTSSFFAYLATASPIPTSAAMNTRDNITNPILAREVPQEHSHEHTLRSAPVDPTDFAFPRGGSGKRQLSPTQPLDPGKFTFGPGSVKRQAHASRAAQIDPTEFEFFREGGRKGEVPQEHSHENIAREVQSMGFGGLPRLRAERRGFHENVGRV
ncbi:hypothetical protein CC86DRAFT_382515 [Ophiobolus disseminans]|uniref:Uncharacterized protein n=1 Tax=Ophiobolus disseminans TaxID=1469910 RepID=A0A6A7A0S4_9PLEO|nr:hypothetical protein CC86DRAFT_382515 [Ophiobolus disseminans]